MAKKITGVVVSDKNDKTIVVMTQTQKTHPIYKKQYRVSSKFHAHDPKNEAKEGDKVIITDTKPISKKKSFMLFKILSRSDLSNTDLEVTKNEDKAMKPDSKKKTEIEEKK